MVDCLACGQNSVIPSTGYCLEVWLKCGLEFQQADVKVKVRQLLDCEALEEVMGIQNPSSWDCGAIFPWPCSPTVRGSAPIPLVVLTPSYFPSWPCRCGGFFPLPSILHLSCTPKIGRGSALPFPLAPYSQDWQGLFLFHTLQSCFPIFPGGKLYPIPAPQSQDFGVWGQSFLPSWDCECKAKGWHVEEKISPILGLWDPRKGMGDQNLFLSWGSGARWDIEPFLELQGPRGLPG